MLCSDSYADGLGEDDCRESRRVLDSADEAMTWAYLDISGNGYLTQNEKLIPGMVKASVPEIIRKALNCSEGMSASELRRFSRAG